MRIIVSTPAKQGNLYERARAAERSRMDVNLLTGLYYRPNRFPYVLKACLPQVHQRRVVTLLEKRRIEGLSPANVVSLGGPALEVALRPLGLHHQWWKIHDWLAAQWILNRAPNCVPTIIHGFQDSSLRTLQAGRHKGMIRLLELLLPPSSPEDLKRFQLSRSDADADVLMKEMGESDFCLAGSEFSVRTLRSLGVPDEHILRNHLGVNTEYFRPRQGPREPGPVRVLFLGGTSRRKGVHHLLDAWKHLHLDNTELILAGNHVAGLDSLSAQSLPQCRVLGRSSDSEYARLLQNADLLVHPSLAEGGCNVVYEGLASGIPCVISTNASSAVRDSIEGIIFPAGDVNSLRDALRRLCLDSDLRMQMGVAARQRAETLTWDRFADRLADIYRGIAEFVSGQRKAVPHTSFF